MSTLKIQKHKTGGIVSEEGPAQTALSFSCEIIHHLAEVTCWEVSQAPLLWSGMWQTFFCKEMPCFYPSDIDECALKQCGEHHHCTNTVGSFYCGACEEGYTLSNEETCIPVGSGDVDPAWGWRANIGAELQDQEAAAQSGWGKCFFASNKHLCAIC